MPSRTPWSRRLRCSTRPLLTTGDENATAPATEARRCVEHLREVTLRHGGDREADDAVLVGSSATVTLQRAIEAWG